MIIESYAVSTASQRSYTSLEATSLTVKSSQGSQSSESASAASLTIETSDVLTLSGQAVKPKKDNYYGGSKSLESILTYKPSNAYGSRSGTNPLDAKISLLEAMIKAITGKDYKFSSVRSFSLPDSNRSINLGIPFQSRQSSGVELYAENFQYESESVSYSAQGIINTADGKQISVDVYMNMSREYSSYTSVAMISPGTRQLCDPLVINYGGTAASLTGETFSFDLDADGSLDRISFVGEGSGFLALDINGDGKINDGSELFGPQSGSGFEDLRKYDLDGNGWIDENDDIFGSLLVWSKDKDGNDLLFSLKDLDIGAIYLGETQTEFSIKNDSNDTLGVMRSTSFYLTESGGAGTISHIDLTL